MFPIPVSSLYQWVPHRPPMVWVDEVVSATADGGECLVRLKPDAHYMNGLEVRSTSMIEWMAQSYAYVRAAQSMSGLLKMTAAPKRAYLVSVQAIQFNYSDDDLRGARQLRIRVHGAREIGPITMFDAQVFTDDARMLCNAKLKVFAE